MGSVLNPGKLDFWERVAEEARLHFANINADKPQPIWEEVMKHNQRFTVDHANLTLWNGEDQWWFGGELGASGTGCLNMCARRSEIRNLALWCKTWSPASLAASQSEVEGQSVENVSRNMKKKQHPKQHWIKAFNDLNPTDHHGKRWNWESSALFV